MEKKPSVINVCTLNSFTWGMTYKAMHTNTQRKRVNSTLQVCSKFIDSDETISTDTRDALFNN